MLSIHRRALVACLVLVASVALRPVALPAQATLALGATVDGRITGSTPLEYRLTMPGAGVLTAVVEGGGDLRLRLLDADGQPISDFADSDLDGVSGREMLTVRVTEGGVYRLQISDFGGESSAFRVGSGFLAFDAFAAPGDSDGRPSGARALTIGEATEEALDPSGGDVRDWYVLTAPKDGTLAIVTRSVGDNDNFDLVLEAFLDGEFLEPAQRSDQDLQDDVAHEGATLAVRAGQQVHIRVTVQSGSGGRYRLSMSLLE